MAKWKGQTTQWPKEEGPDNKMTKRRRTRQHNGQKKKDQITQWPKEEGPDNTMTKWKRTKGQMDRQTIYKTPHRKLKIEQHKPH